MATDGKQKRPESVNFRIWPGVTLIAVCGFLLFLTVYVVSYRSNLIPLPEYLQALLAADEQEETIADSRTEEAEALISPPAEEKKVYYDPAMEDPRLLLASLQSPEQYYQRMRISYMYDSRTEDMVVDLYVLGSSWKLQSMDSEGSPVDLYICDGEKLYHGGKSALSEKAVTPVGEFTPQNLLGLPDLSRLQAEDTADIAFDAEDKNLHITYGTEDLRCECRIALDTGLITDIQLQREGQTVLFMYTELFDMSPAAVRQTGLFTIPDNGGIDR